MVMRSRKPEAAAFSDWVTGEVLPTIRKTGRYGQQAEPPTPVWQRGAGITKQSVEVGYECG